MQASAQPCRSSAIEQQGVGGGQQHLEEHEQVEEIRGQERAVEPGQLEQQQGVEATAAFVARGQPASDPHHGGDGEHHRREPVDGHRDTEGRWPVAERIGPTCAAGGLTEQHQRHRQQRRQRDHRDRAHPARVAHQHQRQRAGQQRQGHGQHRQMRQQSLHGPHGSPRSRPLSPAGSPPSTWSPPDTSRSFSATTINTAVIAKLMTMAVSTSACGSGSV